MSGSVSKLVVFQLLLYTTTAAATILLLLLLLRLLFLLPACYLLPATCYLLPATCYLLPATCYPPAALPAAYYLLTTYYPVVLRLLLHYCCFYCFCHFYCFHYRVVCLSLGRGPGEQEFTGTWSMVTVAHIRTCSAMRRATCNEQPMPFSTPWVCLFCGPPTKKLIVELFVLLLSP